MPRLLASITRFSIWSDMPSPCRPPTVLASWTRSTAEAKALPLMLTGRPCSKPMVTSSGGDLDRRVPEPDAHDRLDDLQAGVQVLQRLRLVGGAPDVRVGGVRLLGAGPVGQVALGQPLRHLRAAAELADEVGVQPRLVDAQRRVRQQAVAVEPLDVVALEGRAVAPDLDVVLEHRAHQQRAGHRAAQRRGVEVGAAAGADVEGAAGQGREALLDQGGPAVDQPRELRAVGLGAARARRGGRARRTGRGRRCRRRERRPSRASTRPRRRCRARRRRRCRRADLLAGR